MDSLHFVEKLSTEEIRQHVLQTHELWGGGQTIEKRFEKQLQRLRSKSDFIMSGLVDQNGRLVSSLKRYHFSICFRNNRLPAIGLGAIFTDTKHRNHGSAEKMIQQVLLNSEKKFGCQASVLFSDIGSKYYSKFGYVEIPSSNWKLDIHTIPDDPVFESRTASDKDIPNLLNWYRQTVRNLAIHTDRTVDDWKFFRELNGIEGDLILSENGQDIGYLTYDTDEDHKYFWIEELGFAECLPNDVKPIFSKKIWATIKKLTCDRNFAEVRGWSYPTFQVENALFEPRKGALPMLKIFDHTIQIQPDELQNAFFGSPDHF